MRDTWPLKMDLSRWPHKCYRVLRWGGSSSSPSPDEDAREEVSAIEDADIISSQIENSELHTIMLDLDVPATLVPSTTPGHSHLYIDVKVCWPAYVKLLEVLGDVGVLERGYVEVSKKKGFTSLRLPWVKKEKRRARHDRTDEFSPVPLGPFAPMSAEEYARITKAFEESSKRLSAYPPRYPAPIKLTPKTKKEAAK